MAQKQTKTETEKKANDGKLDPNYISVKIYSPFKVYFDGPAKSISAENDTGPFDILPRHHNFITLLNPGEITVGKKDGEQKYRISRGIMHVHNNKVTVFLDI